MRMLCTLLAALLLSVSAQAAEITVAKPDAPLSCITFAEPPVSVDATWLPLVDASAYLPICVEWDEVHRKIIITSEDIASKWPWIATQEIAVKHLDVYSDELAIVDGVTYCSPWFLARYMPGVGFVHGGRLWFCDVSPDWEGNLYSAMLRLAVVSPNDYAFVASHLRGVEVAQKTIPNASAYVYPLETNPVAYIIDTKLYGAELASVVAHEAWHVHEHKHGTDTGEVGAMRYYADVLDRLMLELRQVKGLA
jgi:hypothetical protein